MAYFLLHIIRVYDHNGALKTFGVDNELIDSLAKPYFILMGVYFVAFLLSIFFNIKKKYVLNTMFLSIMVVFYMVITVLGVQWLK